MTALDELLTNGFVRFPDILPSDLLTRLRQVTDDLLKEQDEAVRAAVRSQGSMIGTMIGSRGTTRAATSRFLRSFSLCTI